MFFLFLCPPAPRRGQARSGDQAAGVPEQGEASGATMLGAEPGVRAWLCAVVNALL